MKKARIIICISLLLSIVFLGSCNIAGDNDVTSDNVVISDMLLYEHNNSDFYIDVLFDDDGFNGISSNIIVLKIVNSKTFNAKDEPDPIYRSTIKKLEIEYSSLPLKEVSNNATIIPNAPVSTKAWMPDGRKHDLYIIDDKYMLFQYTDDNEYNALYGSMWWHLMYESDKETQAKIIEYADYDDRKNGYQFGPMYYATPEGQIQCIYKYGNCVYYRQIN